MGAEPGPPGGEPVARFGALLERAVAEGLPEPTAAAFATVGPDGRPSVRMLLLKGHDERGFAFYTNLQSRKARELELTPSAAVCFFWAAMEVQVRIEGPVERVSDAEADEYFASRPRGSQVGAWASLQSARLPSREELVERVRGAEERFEGSEVPRPAFWSGFRIVPDRIEFWQGRPSRLHERDVYTRDPDAPGGWRVGQLYP